MTKRVGLLGLLLAATVGMFHPAVASAQDRGDYRLSYVEGGARERGFRGDDRSDYRFRDHEFRENRERQDWRDRDWRRDRYYDRGYVAPPVYGYGYRPPVVGFGFRWNCR